MRAEAVCDEDATVTIAGRLTACLLGALYFRSNRPCDSQQHSGGGGSPNGTKPTTSLVAGWAASDFAPMHH